MMETNKQRAKSLMAVELRCHGWPAEDLEIRCNTDAGAQMLIYDVNGDGLADVITAWHCHNCGLVW